jgi:hypothetical protein
MHLFSSCHKTKLCSYFFLLLLNIQQVSHYLVCFVLLVVEQLELALEQEALKVP